MTEGKVATVGGGLRRGDRLTAVDRGEGALFPVQCAGNLVGGDEGVLGTAQEGRVGEEVHLAVVVEGDLLQGRVDPVGEAAGGEDLVGGDGRLGEVAGDAAVREVEADGDLGRFLVDAIADAEPAADLVDGVEGVAVDALVPVGRGVGRVGELVRGGEAEAHAGPGRRIGGAHDRALAPAAACFFRSRRSWTPASARGSTPSAKRAYFIIFCDAVRGMVSTKRTKPGAL